MPIIPDRNDGQPLKDDRQPLTVGRIEQLWPTPASRSRPEPATDNDPFLKRDRFGDEWDKLKRDRFEEERDKK